MLITKYDNDITDMCAYYAIASSSFESVHWLIENGYSEFINKFFNLSLMNHYHYICDMILRDTKYPMQLENSFETAIMSKNIYMINYLLDTGYYIVKDEYLTEVCSFGDYYLFTKMSGKGFSVSKRCVEIAVKRGDENIIGEIYRMDNHCFENTNCIVIAIDQGNLSMVERLINQGADPNKGNPKPLIAACINGNKEIIELLIKSGATTKEDSIFTMLFQNKMFDLINHLSSSGLVTNENNIQKCIFESIEKNSIDDIPFLLSFVEEKALILNNSLGHSCIHGSVEAINYFLDSGASFLNKYWPDVIRRNNVKILECLYNDSRVKKTSNNGLMRYACYSNSELLIDTLIKHSEDVNAVYEDGKTPILIACEYCSVSFVESLVEIGADLDVNDKDKNTIFHYAVRNESSEVINYLLKKVKYTDSSNIIGETAVHVACRYNRDAGLLIQHGADIKAQDDIGNTPLHAAAMVDSLNNIKILVLSLRNSDIRNFQGQTPLHIACENGSYESIEYLLRSGACINAQDHNENTPLHIACLKQQLSSLKALIKHGADLKVINKDGLTAEQIIVNQMWTDGQRELKISEKDADAIFDEESETCMNHSRTYSKAQMQYKMIQIQNVFKRSYFSKDNIIHDRLKRVIEFLKEYDDINFTQLSHRTGIDPRTLKKIKVSLEDDDNAYNPFSVQSEGRRSMSIRLEESIAFYIRTNYINRNIHFNDRMCYKIAMRFWNKYVEEHIRNDFKCSAKWIRKFMMRHGFSKRKCTPQKRPTVDEVLKRKCIAFRNEIHEIYKKLALKNKLHLLINADETAWRIALENELTWANKGAKKVSLDIQYNEKNSITALAAVSAKKEKLPLSIIAKGKGEAVEAKFTNEHLVCFHSQSGWTTESVFFTWISWLRIQINAKYPDDIKETLHLIIDVYTTHTTQNIKQLCESLKIKLHFIPPGATDIMQPLDRYGFGALKKIAERVWQDFLLHKKGSKITIVDATNVLDNSWQQLSDENLEKQWDIYFDDSIPLFEEEEEESGINDNFKPLAFPEEEEEENEIQSDECKENESLLESFINNVKKRINDYDTHENRALPTVTIKCADSIQNAIIQLLYSIPRIAHNMNNSELMQALFKILDDAAEEVNLLDDDKMCFCEYLMSDINASISQNVRNIFETIHDIGIIEKGVCYPIISLNKDIKSALNSKSLTSYIIKCILFTSKHILHLGDCPESIMYGNQILLLRGFLCKNSRGAVYYWRTSNNLYFECGEDAIIETKRQNIKNIIFALYIPFASEAGVMTISLLAQTYPEYQEVLDSFIAQRGLTIKEKRTVNKDHVVFNAWFKATNSKGNKNTKQPRQTTEHIEEESSNESSYEEYDEINN